MTKGELNTHIEKRYSECCKRSQGLSYGSFYDGYVDCYCEQQKRIEKLEQQIEKMKKYIKACWFEENLNDYSSYITNTSDEFRDLVKELRSEKWETKENDI